MQNCSFFILIALILSSCAVSDKDAPIEYNHPNANLSSHASSDTVPTIHSDGEIISVPKKEEFTPPISDDENYAVPASIKPGDKNSKIIYHEVKPGETIEEIALQYEQTVAEIAKINDLNLPYSLEAPQIIKIKLKDNTSGTKNLLKSSDTTRHQIDSKPLSDFIKPVEGKIITKFGEKTPYGINKGVNIKAPEGTKVTATASGKVIYADFDATFGNLVIVKLNDQNIVVSYAHLEDIIVEKGASIKQGDIVGYIGSTGKIKEPQLHFGIREGKNAIDPLKFVQY